MTVADDERRELASLLLEVGPEAPTLCEGWTTRDLAAHLVARQDRVETQVGLVVRQLVDRIRSGPPWWSLQRLEALDEATNALEYLIHHEDVLRAQPGWKPRTLPEPVNDEIWSRTIRVARLAVRRSSVGVALARPTGASETVRPGVPLGTVRGEPVELALWVYGRTSVADVSLEGDDATIAALGRLRPRL
jgi:hypothetical protein